MSRNLTTEPYTPDEQRVADVINQISGGNLTPGDDPIGILIGVTTNNARFTAEFLQTYLGILSGLIDDDRLDDSDKVGLKMAYMAMTRLIRSETQRLGISMHTAGHA